jgi:lipopolysaccharide/colanic/teichoic acid biosynthesis glycosyltransferase
MSLVTEVRGSSILADSFSGKHERRHATAVSRPHAHLRWKGGFDRVIAAILLVPGLPMIALLVLIIRITSRGPGIYSQKRAGAHGRTFTMYKLRSMRVDAETAVPKHGVVAVNALQGSKSDQRGTGVAVWSQPNDTRITRLGRLLRKLHLDELPQLFNVLKGEMSLVGPRPERPEFIGVLADRIPGYLDRLAIAPGVTGLAQLNLPPDSDFASVRRKLVLDLEYIRDASFFMDVRILLCTILRMLKIPSVWICGLARDVPSFEQHAEGGHGESGPSNPRPSRRESLYRSPMERPLDDAVSSRRGADGGHGANLTLEKPAVH